MQLDYLLFDVTDEETGACSFDAVASVVATRIAPLLHEVEAVLGWACREFGVPSTALDEGEWTFDLQAVDERDAALEVTCDFQRSRVTLADATGGRVTLALTIGGSAAFGQAFKEAFPDSD